jgi:hypothetical protein
MVTTEITSSAVCCTCGPRWTALIMPIHEAIEMAVRKLSSMKVRQNSPLLSQLRRDARGAAISSRENTSAAGLQG